MDSRKSFAVCTEVLFGLSSGQHVVAATWVLETGGDGFWGWLHKFCWAGACTRTKHIGLITSWFKGGTGKGKGRLTLGGVAVFCFGEDVLHCLDCVGKRVGAGRLWVHLVFSGRADKDNVVRTGSV